jgi:heme-degrading monooxygenase HmoA
MFAKTPEPPYVAVIFTNTRTGVDDEGYFEMADRMEALAEKQDGFLGTENARSADDLSITLSYWRDEEAAKSWKRNADHLGAQKLGRETWYQRYILRIATVTRDYEFNRS